MSQYAMGGNPDAQVAPEDQKHTPVPVLLYYCGFCRRELMPVLNAQNEITGHLHLRRKVKERK